MSYLPDFEYDVFLSYAHLDNKTPDNTREGWITKFYKQFKLELDRYLESANTASVWCDHKLSGNMDFDARIKTVLDSSVLLLAFSSNAYSRSEYCKDELNHFFTTTKNSKTGISVKESRRIFNIQLLNKPFQSWPEPFQGGGKYTMFKSSNPQLGDNDQDLGITLDPDLPSDREKYNQCLFKIVLDVCSTLTEIKKQIITPAPPDAPKKKIFIAKTSDTLLAVKGKIISGLTANDISVEASAIPPPWERNEHEKLVTSKMSDTVLSVHLFDSIAGDKIAKDYPYSFSQEQLLIGKRLKKEQLIFIPQELNIENITDKEHGRFLTELMTKKEDAAKYNLVRELSDQDIITHIMDRINKPPPPPDIDGTILLDFHEMDLASAIDYYNTLQSENRKIYLTRRGNEPLDIISRYDKALQEVTTVIIVSFTVATNWLLERIKEIICAIRTGKSHIKKLMVYRKTGIEEIDLEEMRKVFG
jgi:hypothetical protein